jgi:hypothetical protein
VDRFEVREGRLPALDQLDAWKAWLEGRFAVKDRFLTDLKERLLREGPLQGPRKAVKSD